ncbi:hypothetical protein N9C75_03610 [Alphaproteobacteria bacterium]|nr:hypothetical protein [Alphaproteobacteria bacterium]
MTKKSQLLTFIESRVRCNICLDQNSYLFGCCDRNFWHYKIRDFSSIILQQGAEVEFRRLQRTNKKEARKFALGAINFWSNRAVMRNSFEEYYPFEDGYPPLAFSTLSIVRIIKLAKIKINEVPLLKKALEKSSEKLLKRREVQALNQYSAAIAALAGLTKLEVFGTSEVKFRKKLNDFLSYQTVEGWFPEYGSYDIGYLSVTLDCLWDVYDDYPSAELLKSITQASDFIASILSIQRVSFGKFNSRNTDYVLPYGLLRTFCLNPTENLRLALIQIEEKSQLYNSLDDRYLMHYIGISLIRSQNLFLRKIPKLNSVQKDGALAKKKYELAGIYRVKYKEELGWLNIRKGVICSKNYSEWGFRIMVDGEIYETGVVPMSGDKNKTLDGFQVSLTKLNEFVPSFVKLTIIKILAFFFGFRLIEFLKKRVIHRTDSKAMMSYDERLGLSLISTGFDESKAILISKSPPQSIRHVASAEWNL